jgi:hypothetical protein
MSLTVIWRSSAALLVAAGTAVPAHAAGFVAGSPVWRDSSAVRPCDAGLTVRVPVRRPATPPATLAYAVEASLRVVDSRGYARAVSDGVALRNPAAVVGLLWDGLVVASNGTASPAAAGNVTATLDLTLVSLSQKPTGTMRTVLETYRATTSARVLTAGATCAAWAARSTRFSLGEHGRVVVNGRETTLLPRATWRGGRLFGVSGNLASPARADLGALTEFIQAYPDLFGEVASAQLRLETVGRDPTGITRLTATQRTRDGFRALNGRIAALFDADQRLVAVTGPILQGVYDMPIEFAVSEATALANVAQELVGRGYDPATRSLRVRERVVLGQFPGLQAAYLIEVGPGPSARPNLAAGTIPAATDWHTFAFVVSGQTGLIVDEWTRSSANWVRGSVNNISVADACYMDPLLAPSSATPSAAPPRVVVNRPVWLDAVAAGGQYHLVDHYRPGSILDTVVAAVVRMPALGCSDVCWIPMHWPTFDLTPWSSPHPAHVTGFHSTLMRGFELIQEHWDVHYAPWLGAQAPTPVTLWSSTDIPGFPLPGGFVSAAYTFDEGRGAIWLHPVDYWGTPEQQDFAVRSAGHELFHHFDEITVGLRRRSGDQHRMPTALKEGLAEFTSRAGFGAYPLDNVHHVQLAGNTSATLCSLSALLGNDPWVCFDDMHDRFRVRAVGFHPFHRPMVQGRSLLEPWPDCRTQPQPLVDCHVALPSGAGGTYSWPPGSPTHAGEYELVAQTLLDAWESSTSAVASATSAAQARTYGQTVFPSLVVGAFLTLPPDASLLDLRDALVMQVALDPFVTTALPSSAAGVPVAEIEAAFDRHGIDGALRQFCQDPATQSLCH